MRSIYEYTNYREYLTDFISAKGDRAHGFKLRIAEALKVSSSLVSQVFKGQKTFSPEQAFDLCEFLGLNELEADYLHLLVDFDRTSSARYREKLHRKMRGLRNQSLDLGKRVPRNKELTDEQKSIYYSSWLYTGIRNLTAIPEYDRPDVMAERLHLDQRLVNRIVEFLVQNQLCREEAGKLTYGPAATHVDNDSPFVNNHHQNWRFQAIQRMEHKLPANLFFTSPMSLSQEAFEEIRALLPTMIERIMKISGPSPSESVACLNIDWFEY